VLEGAFALLEALERVGEAGLTALAAESGLPKSSAHHPTDRRGTPPRLPARGGHGPRRLSRR
jgi:hypothetical protein